VTQFQTTKSTKTPPKPTQSVLSGFFSSKKYLSPSANPALLLKEKEEYTGSSEESCGSRIQSGRLTSRSEHIQTPEKPHPFVRDYLISTKPRPNQPTSTVPNLFIHSSNTFFTPANVERSHWTNGKKPISSSPEKLRIVTKRSCRRCQLLTTTKVQNESSPGIELVRQLLPSLLVPVCQNNNRTLSNDPKTAQTPNPTRQKVQRTLAAN